jgi:Na+-translocating ferredoxin:NAD+ oxidoreductase RnfD subunit
VTLGLQVFLMWVHVRTHDLEPPWSGGFKDMVTFLLPAYPPGVAVAMLLYPNERLWPIVFAAVLAIASKPLFRAPIGGGRSQHIFNPSNFGITVTLFLFPSVGLAPPYHFTENVTGLFDWLIPGAVLLTGIIVHSFSTGRLPLIAAWLVGFVAQGLLRSLWFGTPMLAPLAPMTSVGFILFTLYMLPDPGTTPLKTRSQIAFGLTVAAVYGLLQINHVLFGLVLSLTLVCGMRGIWLYFQNLGAEPRPGAVPSAAAGG